MTQQRISIFGDIGIAITADSVQAQLAMFDRSKPLLVKINSDGGAVSEGMAIYNLLRTWPGGVSTEIVGWALSIASVIAMAGKPIRAHETAILMVHAPWMSTSGNAGELRECAAVLDQVKETLTLAYARTGQRESVVRSWLDGADHWFTAAEALALGLVDEVMPADANTAAAASANVFATCRFPVPPHLAQRITAMNAPQPKNGLSNLEPNLDAIRAEAVRAEGQRRTDIRNAFKPWLTNPDAAAYLARAEADPAISAAAAKTEMLNILARGVTPANYYGGTGLPFGDDQATRLNEFKAAARDVLLTRAGLLQRKDAHPAAADLQRHGVVAMAEQILSMHGRSTRDMSKSEIINAALTTSDFTQLLANLAGKALQVGYETDAATHAVWTAEREVADFKTQTLVALSEAPALTKIIEGGEYQHGSLSDSASTFALETFGKIVRITRQALVNDDLSAFTKLPQSMGMTARRLEADTVYARLESSAVLSDGLPLFHADHGNLSAAAGDLSLTTLSTARAAMRRQRGIGGLAYIDPQPRYLIVPVSMETHAEQLILSLVDPAKQNDTGMPKWVRNLTLVADPRLSDAAWYLAADTRQIEGLVRAYLAGEERPHVEEQIEFNTDAHAVKCRLDFAVGVVDYRALFKHPI